MVIVGAMIEILKAAFNDSKCVSAHIFASINSIIYPEVSEFLSESWE